MDHLQIRLDALIIHSIFFHCIHVDFSGKMKVDPLKMTFTVIYQGRIEGDGQREEVHMMTRDRGASENNVSLYEEKFLWVWWLVTL